MNCSSEFFTASFDNKDGNWSFTEDGFALISDKSYGPTLVIRSKENPNDSTNVNYFNMIISEDLDFEYKESTNNTGYTVRFKQNNQRLGIKFEISKKQKT